MLKKLSLVLFFITATSLNLAAHSIYNVSRSPFAAEVATSVGDLITVIIDENANAVDKGQNKNEIKDNSMDSMLLRFIQTYFGADSRWKAAFANKNGERTPGLATETKKFDGTAENKNSHNMTTRLQGRIIEILSPDQMYVKASRTISINGKQKTIFISGVVRRQDITSNIAQSMVIENSVRSEQIADAIIEIDGQVVNKDLQPGLLSKLFRKVF